MLVTNLHRKTAHKKHRSSHTLCICLSALLGTCLLSLPQASRAQSATSPTYTLLHTFPAAGGSQGVNPATSLVEGSDGNYYGTTQYGGPNNTGTIYKITPAGVLTTIYSFSKCDASTNYKNADGVLPFGALVQGSDGNLYGTTESGGTNEYGTFFKITPSGVLTSLYAFGGSSGEFPKYSVALGPDGNFYGATENGGTYDNGTLFKITPSGSLTTLYTFSSDYNSYTKASGNADGSEVSGVLTLGSDGSFYGMTEFGGPNNNGTLFKVTTAGVFTTLYSFSQLDSSNHNADGVNPNGTLAEGKDGDYYGVAFDGGENQDGTAFKITPTGAFTSLYQFGDNTYEPGGTGPVQLVSGSDGNFYGSALLGGDNATGAIFQLTPAGAITPVYSFDQSGNPSGGVSGVNNLPDANLSFDRQGNLYGTTISGGTNGTGTIFKLSIPGVTMPPTRFDFNQDGHADLIWYNTGSGGVSVWDMNDQSVLQYGGVFTQRAPSTGWIPVASPDANGDGYPDLLWWNSLYGYLTLYTLQNTTVEAKDNNFAQIKNINWKPVAVADNSGGAWTMVLQNKASGDIARWLMNGDKVVNVGPVFASLGAHSPWQVVGAPDLNGDSKSDLLFWNSQTGEVSSWNCNLANSQVLSYNGDIAQVSDTSWHLVGSEDSNGDGHPDLIWWNAKSGIESRWLLNGTTVTAYGGASTQVTDTTWQPTAIR